jgi:hydroxyacylglutathione hydrolase
MQGNIPVVRLPDDEGYHYWEMFPDTWAIQYGEGLYCFLLVGQEKALLIDTGYGRGDFPNVVDRLTDKPIVLANTHGHYDHTGGNAWFPKAYMHPEAAKIARKSFGPIDPAFWANMPYPDYEIECIEDGYVFDLGGREVEALHTPCHSSGSLTFLDHGQRLLFPGDEFDSAQANLFGYDTIPAFLSNMKRLKAREAEYDYILPQHNGCPITKRYVDDFIRNAEDILAGHPHYAVVDDAPGYEPGGPWGMDRIRSRVGHSSIVYEDPNKPKED